MSEANVPVFVVVGNVNQGKSSIVATLAENEGVRIDSLPGTTERCAEFSFEAGGKTLFRLIDTPGFQDARRALQWMRKRSVSAADRRQTVRDFVAEHQNTDQFVDEQRLLGPILRGASILYVIDASSHLQPSQEAEMEILRWTGQPAMALINRTREERDRIAQWRPTLQQFFSVVREFDAHGATFEDRLGLLRSFREVRDDWRAPMDEAIAAMEREWQERRQQAARTLSNLMADALSHVEKASIPETGEAPVGLKEKLEEGFRAALRNYERLARQNIEEIYRHASIEVRSEEARVLDADLFSGTSWKVFGLTRTQLGLYGVAWGAAIGGVIDLMVGGLSFFTGLVTGAVVGGVAGYLGSVQVARTWGNRSRLAKQLFPQDHGFFLCQGPVTNPAFAWMLLDRALFHYKIVRDRAHAQHEAVEVSSESNDEKVGIAATLPRALRDPVDSDLQQVLKSAVKGGVPSLVRDQLAANLVRILETC